MRTVSLKKKVVIAAVSAATLGISGVAYAYVVSSGKVDSTGGNGTVTPATGTIGNVTWSAGTVSGLHPGTSANVTITFSNPNTYSVDIGQHTFSVDTVAGPALSTCLDNSVALLSTASTTATSFVVPPGVSTKTTTVSVSMADSPTIDQTDCIGANLDVAFKLT